MRKKLFVMRLVNVNKCSIDHVARMHSTNTIKIHT